MTNRLGSHAITALLMGAGVFAGKHYEQISWKIFGIVLMLIALFYAGYKDSEGGNKWAYLKRKKIY